MSAKDTLPKFRQTDDPYNIPPCEWEEISKDTVRSNATFPVPFRDNMKAFGVNCHKFKSANWSRWTLSESLCHYFKRLDRFHYAEYLNFVMIIRLSTLYQITLVELEQLYYRILRFSKYMEEYMYRYDYDRVGACRPVFHQLRHVAEAIRWAGLMYVYWQFSMERLCGMIKFQIKSRSKTNVNIANVQQMVEQTNLLPYVLDNVKTADGGWAYHDEDGYLLLERLLGKALRTRQKSKLLIEKNKQGIEWEWDDVFSDNSVHNTSSEGDSLSSDDEDRYMDRVTRSAYDPSKSFKRISRYRRLLDKVPKRYYSRKLSPFQQTLLRDRLQDWYKCGDFEHDLDEKAIAVLMSEKMGWKEIIRSAEIWRSMDIKCVTRIGSSGYIAKTRKMRISGTEYRRTNSTRSCSMAELKPHRTAHGHTSNKEDRENSYPGSFVDVHFFVSVSLPYKRMVAKEEDESNENERPVRTMFVNGVKYECLEYHIAIAREIPVKREGILLEARLSVKGRQIIAVPCGDIKELVGLIVSRDRKYVVWDHGCFDFNYIHVFENGFGWMEDIKKEALRQKADRHSQTDDEKFPVDQMDLDPPYCDNGPLEEEEWHSGDGSYDSLFDDPIDDEVYVVKHNKNLESDEEMLECEEMDMKMLANTWKTSSDPESTSKKILNRFKGHYTIHDVKGDGNCGFRVVAWAVLGDVELHESVRISLSDFFTEHKERYMSDAYHFVRPRQLSRFEPLLADLKGESSGRNRWYSAPFHTQLTADYYGVFIAVLANPDTMLVDIYIPRNDKWTDTIAKQKLKDGEMNMVTLLLVDRQHWRWVKFDFENKEVRSMLMKGIEEDWVKIQWGCRPMTTEL